MSNLKDQFLQPPFIRKLGEALESNVPGVHSAAFAKSVTESPWSELELMDRMRKVTDCLRDFLPEDYPEAVKILRMIGPGFSGFDALVFADFVGRYGVDHLNE